MQICGPPGIEFETNAVNRADFDKVKRVFPIDTILRTAFCLRR